MGTLIRTGLIIDRVTRVAPLGMRFWDYVTGSAIGCGLQAAAYLAGGDPERVVKAITNKSAVYVFYGLPGMRSVEFGAGDAAFWAAPPARRTFTISVSDAEERFIPFSFNADLPVRGLFGLQCGGAGSPPAVDPVVPLYSSPSRSVPAGMAAVRAELRLPPGAPGISGDPAAWAVLEVRLPGGATVRGIADQNGRVVVIFPYPEPAPTTASPPVSPPSSGSADLRLQEWPIEVRAGYVPVQPVPTVPDLCAALTQPAATLWANSSLSTPLVGATLRFGRDLVLRSVDSTTHQPMAALLVTPAASPP